MKPADIVRLLILSTLWGGSFILLRIAAPVLGPVVLIAVRVLLAGVALLAFALFVRQPLALRTRWRDYLVLGALGSAVPFVLISIASLQLTASMTAILNATSPVFGALFAALFLRDSLSLRKVAGMLLGMVGVGIITGFTLPVINLPSLLAIGASLAAAACYGLGGTYTRARLTGAPALGMAVGSQLAAAVILWPIVPFYLPNSVPSLAVIVVVLTLALLCTAFAYVLYYALVVNVGPMQALTVTFLTPLFGVIWGRIFLNEQITIGTIAGGAVVLLGTALVTGVQLPVRGGFRCGDDGVTG